MNKVKLLIADDEASIRNGLSNVIAWEEYGIQLVGVAANGRQALEMMRASRPDIVITDIRMPHISGLELIELARKENAGTYFIILSGYDDFGYAQRAIRSQVSSYLLKPIKTTELVREMERACGVVAARRRQQAQWQENEFAVRRGTGMLQEHFYHRLARGEYHSEGEIQEAAAALGVVPLACPCVAIALRFTLPPQEGREHFGSEDALIFKAAIRNIVAELAQPKQLTYFSEENKTIGFLMEYPAEPTAFAKNCLHELKRLGSIGLSAGIGGVANALPEVEASCRQAYEAVEYHMYQSGENIFDAVQLAKNQGATPHQPPPMQNLAEAVIMGDVSRIEQELSSFFLSLFYIPMPPPRYVRGMCAYVLCDVDKRIPAHLKSNLPTLVNDWLRELEKQETFSAIQGYLRGLFFSIAQHLAATNAGEMANLMEQAKQYINSNLFTRLRARDVAAQVHMSESYLASMFKKHNGETLRGYILNSKLEKAKELLWDDSLTVFEIAEKLEYGDYRSFSRAFKRYFGQSPTEYRGLLTKGGGENGPAS